ncbi:unnamed protein product [Lactuca virosa]|uniref:Uncharacterized protein n=1 Tax=Lactuca virosa TaxID=75947 RepID=A0AAU9MBT1_9ASTR|nr:unnamed protein product [Lactuca virosa]
MVDEVGEENVVQVITDSALDCVKAIKTNSQELVVESVEPKDVESSNPISSQGDPKKVRKAQFTRRGVLFREVTVPGSPTSKKHRAIDMAQKLNKKKHEVQVPLENVTFETKHDSDSDSLRVSIAISIDDVDKRNDERILNHFRNLTGEVSKLHDVSKECHELFAKQLEETKVYLQTQIADIRTMLKSEVKNFAESSSTLHKMMDVVAEALVRSIEDITSFNKDYTIGLQDKMKGDALVFSRVEEFLTEIKTMLSAQSTISPESISQMELIQRVDDGFIGVVDGEIMEIEFPFMASDLVKDTVEDDGGGEEDETEKKI